MIVGISGTDTGVGKTVVACALLAACVQRGSRVAPMKPVETGVARDAPGSDHVRLAAAAHGVYESTTLAPYVFPLPVAPLVAARAASTTIDGTALDAACARLAEQHDVVVVEGAGGLLVPITPALAFSHLFARWNARLVLVAPNRLGVVNHVRLSVLAAQMAGIHPGVIALVDAPTAMHDASTASNSAVLHELAPEWALIRFPWMPSPCDHPSLAAAAESSGLVQALGLATY